MSKKKRSIHMGVHVEVLQNGSTLNTYQTSLSQNKVLALTDDRGKPLSIPHFPLPNGRLEFIRIADQKITLLIEYNWEGFCTSAGDLVNMGFAEKGRRVVELEPGDYGSISRNDLRILFKIAPMRSNIEKVHKLPRSYRQNIFAGFIRGSSEKTAAWAAIGFLLIIFGGIAAGFYHREYFKPKKIDDLADSYILPFVAGDHLIHSPEALQSTLNRQDYLRSTLAFYRSFTSVLMGWKDAGNGHVFASTADLYQKLFAAVGERIQGYREEQADINSKQLDREQGVLSIPAVIGESQAGSILRVIDKIDIAHQSYAMTIAARRTMTQIFHKEEEQGAYNYENYRDSAQKTPVDLSQLSKIRTWSSKTDEEFMYYMARKLGAEAKVARDRIAASGNFGDPVNPENSVPLALPGGVSFASFLDDVDFMSADARIDEMVGTKFGTNKPKAKAPPQKLSGVIDRNLIQSYIESNRYQLKLCYDVALRRNEAAQGTMEWSFRINPRGQIYEIALISSTISDEKMAQCIRQKLSRWQFPRPRHGSVEIRYPFSFAPAKG